MKKLNADLCPWCKKDSRTDIFDFESCENEEGESLHIDYYYCERCDKQWDVIYKLYKIQKFSED